MTRIWTLRLSSPGMASPSVKLTNAHLAACADVGTPTLGGCPDGYGTVAVVRQPPKAVRFLGDLLAGYGQFYLMALITMNGGTAASSVDQPEGSCGRG